MLSNNRKLILAYYFELAILHVFSEGPSKLMVLGVKKMVVVRFIPLDVEVGGELNLLAKAMYHVIFPETRIFVHMPWSYSHKSSLAMSHDVALPQLVFGLTQVDHDVVELVLRYLLLSLVI